MGIWRNTEKQRMIVQTFVFVILIVFVFGLGFVFVFVFVFGATQRSGR